MKKLALSIIAICAIAFVNAQALNAAKVPNAVKESCTKHFPEIKNVKWELENGQYEASFKKDGHDESAMFKKDGTFTESEVDIKFSELPSAVTPYIKEHYKGISVKEASKITKANGEVNYEAAIKGKDIIFDFNGKFIKEMKD